MFHQKHLHLTTVSSDRSAFPMPRWHNANCKPLQCKRINNRGNKISYTCSWVYQSKIIDNKFRHSIILKPYKIRDHFAPTLARFAIADCAVLCLRQPTLTLSLCPEDGLDESGNCSFAAVAGFICPPDLTSILFVCLPVDFTICVALVPVYSHGKKLDEQVPSTHTHLLSLLD